MRLEEVFHFNDASYRKKIQRKEFTYAQLAKGIYAKRRNITTSKVTVYTTVICVPVTFGVSLLATANAFRNINVEKRKLFLLEEEWQRCGQTRLPKRFIKDTLIPVILTTAIGVLTFTVDVGISSMAANAAYNAQMGIPSMEFQGHAVGAVYTVVENGMGMAARGFNEQIAEIGSSSRGYHY
jgi:hypothetical protein